MNILIVTGIFPPDIGGPANYIPVLARMLKKRGNNVHVITLSDSLTHKDSEYNFLITRIKRSQPKLKRWIQEIYIVLKLARNYDVIYINGIAFTASIGAILAGIPIVLKVAGDYAWEVTKRRGWFNGSINEFQKISSIQYGFLKIVRLIPSIMARKIIVPSVYLKILVKQWGIKKSKISVVYNSFETPKISGHEPILPIYNGKTIITICRLVSWKGVDGLIHLLKRLQNVRLVILGNGMLRGEYENLGRKLGVEDRLIFKGEVPKNYVYSYLKQSDVFVLNSSYEGLPHVILEAMVSEIPVIATNAGGTSEVVKDGVTGRLVPVDDITMLETKVISTFSEIGKTEQYVKNAYNLCNEQFNLNNMINMTENILKKEIRCH